MISKTVTLYQGARVIFRVLLTQPEMQVFAYFVERLANKKVGNPCGILWYYHEPERPLWPAFVGAGPPARNLMFGVFPRPLLGRGTVRFCLLPSGHGSCGYCCSLR